MKYNRDPELSAIQKKVHKHLKSIFGSEGQEMQHFVRNVFQYLKDRDPNKPVWGESVLGRELGLVFEAALDKGGLFNLIIKNLGAILNLVALFVTKHRREKFNEAMSDQDFTKTLYEDEDIRSFVREFDGDIKAELSDEERIAKIQNVINIIVNIPERDEKSFLDREFIRSVFDLIQNNKDKLKPEDLQEILKLFVSGKFIDPTDAKEKQKNTFAIAKAAIKLVKDFDGLGNPIEVKKSQISKLIVGAISKNAPGIIDEKAFEKVLEQIATKEGMDVVLKKAEKIIDALDRDEPNYSLVVGHVIDLLGGELYEGVKEVLNDPNMILSQCFEVVSQKENGEVVYKLSSLGKTLVSKDLIKVPEDVATNVDSWTVSVRGNPEFSVQAKKDFLGVKITKEVFEAQVMQGFDVSALRSISQGLFSKKETIKDIGNIMQDLGNGMPVFAWLSKALKMVKGNPDLIEKLSLHHGFVTELAGKLTPADLLSSFGLEKSFLGIIKPLLKDQKTVESIESIVTQLGSENSSQMTHEAIQLLNENPELAEFLQKPEMREQLASLVDKLSGSIEMMREYLSRTEFMPLKEELKPSLNRLLDETLRLATGNLLGVLDLNMGCSQLVNGFMLGERVSNIQDRVKADAAAKELYLILANNGGEVPAGLTIDQLAKLAPLGIESVEQLQAELLQGQINMAGYELYNQVNFVFKADFPPDQIASKQELIAKIAAERALAFEILSAGGDVEAAIKAAQERGEIAPERAQMFKQVFQTYNDKVAGFEEGTEKLCARFKYEIQMRKLESALVACNSEAIFSLVSRDVVAAGDMTEEQLKEFIRSNSFLPEGIATILMAGNESISTDELKSKLSDISCRKRGGEGVGDIQLMLGDVLAPFSSILQMPYSVQSATLESLEDQLGDSESFTRDQIKAFLNEKLGNPADIEVITSQLIVGEDPITRVTLIDNLRRITLEQEQAEKDKLDVIPALNKLLHRIPQNPTMLRAVKRVITEKGTPDSQSDVIVEAIGEIFTTDLYSIGEKRLLANKVVKPVLRQMQMPVSVINAIENVVDKVLESKEAARSLYTNRQIKDILKKLLTQEISSLVWSNFTSSMSALWNLGVSSSAAIGKQFAWSVDVKQDPLIVGKFKAHLDIVRANAAEGEKVKIQSILRRYFRKTGLYTLSGQDLSGIDLSQTIISNAVFEQTAFSTANLENAEFVKCAFNKCKIPQDLQLTGSKFDLKSFQSFIENAEANKLDINKLLAGVTVISNGVPQGMDARLVYGLMQECKARKVPFSQNVLIGGVKTGKTYEDFYLFCGEGLQAMQRSIGGVSILSLYESGKFSGLNEEQAREVTGLLNFSGSAMSADKLDAFLLFLKSPQYANISRIASILGVDNNTRMKIYADLQEVDVPELEEIKASLAVFKPSSDLRDLRDESVSALLKQWYLNRAGGRMIPEASRNTVSDTKSLIRKAISFKEDVVVDSVTKAIASKLLNDRFLKYSDRMHDLERMHAAIEGLVADLSPGYKAKLGASDITKLANDAYALMYPHTTYERLSVGELYIASGVTVEQIKGWLSSRFTAESIAVNEIIQRAPSLEMYKAELLEMPLDVLEVIAVDPTLFAERSAVEAIPGAVYGSTPDSKIHDQMYELEAEDLQTLLGTSGEIFNIIKDYSKKSDIHLSGMVGHLDVLNNLKSLSDQLIARYKLVGNSTSEKLCLNLAAKLYTDSAEVKALIGDENCRTILANVFFVELQKLETEIPPIDLTKLEVCSRILSAKLGAAHTPELVEQSMAQGRTIAEGIFEKLGIARVWQNPETTEKSISNLANTLGAKIFESGKLIDERNLASIIGEKKPVQGIGIWTSDQSTGLVKAYQDIYYASMSVRNPWYEVNQFDKKDNHTIRLLQAFDALISGQSRAL